MVTNWESVSTDLFMNVHIYKRVQFIELVKEIMVLINIWDKKEEEGCMIQFSQFSLEFSGKAELQQVRPFVSVHQNISAKVSEV